jgi:hypothetical protein
VLQTVRTYRLVFIPTLALCLTACGASSANPASSPAPNQILRVTSPAGKVTLIHGGMSSDLSAPYLVTLRQNDILQLDLVSQDGSPFRSPQDLNPDRLVVVSGMTSPSPESTLLYRAKAPGDASLEVVWPCKVPACAAAGFIVHLSITASQ